MPKLPIYSKNQKPSDGLGYHFTSPIKALEDAFVITENLENTVRNVSGFMSEIKSNEKAIQANEEKIRKTLEDIEIPSEEFAKFGYSTETLLERLLKLPDDITSALYFRGNAEKLETALQTEINQIKTLGRRQEEARLRVFQTESTEETRQKEVLKDALSKARASYDSLKLMFGKGWIPFRKEGFDLILTLVRLQNILGTKEHISSQETAELFFDYLFKLRKGQRPEEELKIVLETKNELALNGVKLDKAAELEADQIYNWLTSIERHGLIGAYLKWSHKTSAMADELFEKHSQEKQTMTKSLRALLKINESLKRLEGMTVVSNTAKFCQTEAQLLEALQLMGIIAKLAREFIEVLPDTQERQQAWIDLIEDMPKKYPSLVENGEKLLQVLGWMSTGPDQLGLAIEKSKNMLNPNVSWVGSASQELVHLRKVLSDIEHELLETKTLSYLIALFGTEIVEKPDLIDSLSLIADLARENKIPLSLVLKLCHKENLYQILNCQSDKEDSANRSRKIAKLYLEVGKAHQDWAVLSRLEIKSRFEQVNLALESIKPLLSKNPQEISAQDMAEALKHTHQFVWTD